MGFGRSISRINSATGAVGGVGGGVPGSGGGGGGLSHPQSPSYHQQLQHQQHQQHLHQRLEQEQQQKQQQHQVGLYLWMHATVQMYVPLYLVHSAGKILLYIHRSTLLAQTSLAVSAIVAFIRIANTVYVTTTTFLFLFSVCLQRRRSWLHVLPGRRLRLGSQLHLHRASPPPRPPRPTAAPAPSQREGTPSPRPEPVSATAAAVVAAGEGRPGIFWGEQHLEEHEQEGRGQCKW